MKRIILVAMILLIGGTGCITTGSKDKEMIKTVADILVIKGELSPMDRGIIIGIIDGDPE